MKKLTFEIFRRSPHNRRAENIFVQLDGWGEVAEFLEANNTQLIVDSIGGINFMKVPKPWDWVVVDTENV